MLLAEVILDTISYPYLGLMFVAAYFIAMRLTTLKRKVMAFLIVLAVLASPMFTSIVDKFEYRLKYSEAKRIFDERCKIAGIKIYRTANDVDGILLENVRRSNVTAHEADPMWSDAGLPHELPGDSYLSSFLYWEQHQDKRRSRGYLNSYISDLPGYRYVDVVSESGIVRVQLDTSNRDMPVLLRAEVPKSSAQFAVGHENFVDPRDRKYWIAGTRVYVREISTGRIYAEAVWYSMEPGFGSLAGHRQPWRYAVTCPSTEKSWQTRFFVDSVLKPMKERS